MKSSRSYVGSLSCISISLALMLAIAIAPACAQSQNGNAENFTRLKPSLVTVAITDDADMGGKPHEFRNGLIVSPSELFSLSDVLKLASITQFAVRRSVGISGVDATGFADIIQNTWLSPARKPSAQQFGFGAVLLAPTASNDESGQGQWGAGPSTYFIRQAKAISFGLVANQTWGFAGKLRSRPYVDRTYFFPFFNCSLSKTTTLALSSDDTYDWTGKTWSTPITAGVNQLVASAGQKVVIGTAVRYYAADEGSRLPVWGAALNVSLLFGPR